MIIATRTLSLRNGKPDTKIPVRIFLPEVHKDGAWSCNYEIGWPSGTRKSSGWGVDAVQSLTLTFQKIALEIYASDYHQSGHLFWEAPASGYGFPPAPNMRDLLVGDDAKYF